MFSFTTFANQPPRCYTPPSRIPNTLLQNQAGDLQIPGTGIALGGGILFSISTSEVGSSPGPVMNPSSYEPAMHTHQSRHYDQLGHSQQPQQPPYTSSPFMHQNTGYESIEHDGSPMDDEDQIDFMDSELQNHSTIMTYQPGYCETNLATAMPPLSEKFRFHVTLNAPTAMTKHADEIPISYLNKGQVYSISVVDTAPTLPKSAGTMYRTFIRISFEDEQQRQRPATCWQLWKEGRGTSEAHWRDGKLIPVEYVKATQPAGGNFAYVN